MNADLSDIVEVLEQQSKNGCNEYLEHGYQLIAVEQTAFLKTEPGSIYVQKRLVYVLGRTAEVPAWSRPYQEREAAKDQSSELVGAQA